ncbi:DNA methyltransferase [Planctomycetota bacterium]
MIETREQWRSWVTPKALRSTPIHRWYAFPHSFTAELVEALIDEWNLTEWDHILDPFAGAGTTVLAAKARGIPATGCDLSPFAAFVSRVKTRDYNLAGLEECWTTLERRIRRASPGDAKGEYPELVRQALPPGILGTLESLEKRIAGLPACSKNRDFFRLALLSVIPYYSRAVATGGWLKWVPKRTKKTSIPRAFADRVGAMLNDLRTAPLPKGRYWKHETADARNLPWANGQFSAIITSPPYPNRHDYTRVFGVELMFAFLSWEETRRLRYQSIHSHPEARPKRPPSRSYVAPTGLEQILSQMEVAGLDAKILSMLNGYFLDMHLCLKEAKRVAVSGARLGFVVGNAQYRGYPLPVDEYVAELGESTGLKCERIIAVRLRGNSAQQMGEFGRQPSRESIVVFQKLPSRCRRQQH